MHALALRTLALTTLVLAAALPACTSDDAGSTASARSTASAVGAAPSLNDGFRADDLDVEAFITRFEGESREIAAQRDGLVAALAIQPGEALADVGAGTGLFLTPFHRAVGGQGRVYAVDISEGFMAHMEQRIAAEGLNRVTPVLCDERSARLPPDSVDVIFICDTYHHFEHPFETMASLREALRPGGRLVIVDFERIPGVSRDWLLEHVRCDKQTVIDEVTESGFRLDAELEVEGLSENYVLRFELQD